jgi:glycosyltransferase involved in cell wall biosynthesis
MKNFVTIFPAYRDFHFYKDPGQIPFRFSKLGYSSTIVCWNNDENYKITSQDIPIKIIKKTFINSKLELAFIFYLIFNSRKINILNVFHLKWESLWFVFWYKLVNPKGFVYLKMDNCFYAGIYPWEEIFDKKVKRSHWLSPRKNTWKQNIYDFLTRKFVKYVDLWSVEDDESREYYSSKYPFFKDKLITAYNGHTIDLIPDEIQVKLFENKENLIITAGRLGTFPKNTLNILEGFANSAKMHNWKLKLAGPIDPEFNPIIEDFFQKYPELVNRVIFTGNLNKTALFDLYNSSKIFLFPSLFEAFSNVYSESMYFSNAIITSPYTSLKDIIINEEIGLLVDPNSSEEIGNAIIKLINDKELLEEYCNNARKFAIRELNWDKLIKILKNEINKRML